MYRPASTNSRSSIRMTEVDSKNSRQDKDRPLSNLSLLINDGVVRNSSNCNSGSECITSNTSSIMLQCKGVEDSATATSSSSNQRIQSVHQNESQPYLIPVGDTHTLPSTTKSQIKEDLKANHLGEMVGHKNLLLLQELRMQEGVASILNTDLSLGIDRTTYTHRISQYGRNELPSPVLLSLLDFMLDVLKDKTMIILVIAAILSLILGLTTPDPRTGEVELLTGWIEGAAILLSVMIVTLISSINNYQKQIQFADLAKESDKLGNVVVIRDGELSEVGNRDIVTGDLVVVYSGIALSFDGLLVRGEGFSCDESSVTGEADKVCKSLDVDPFLLSGTNITDGSDGIALVVAVGPSSFAGSIALSINDSSKQITPLQEKLEAMADLIGQFGLAAAIFTFASLCLKEIYVVLVVGTSGFYIQKLFENITTAVAIVVVAVPEGLPLAVTISLAYSMKQMLHDNNLIRHLSACETMGGATTICADKTGTLTTTDMSLSVLYIEGETYEGLNSAGIQGDGKGSDGVVSVKIGNNNNNNNICNGEHSLPWSFNRTTTAAGKYLIYCAAYNTSDVLGGNKTNEALTVIPSRLCAQFGYSMEDIAKQVASINTFSHHSNTSKIHAVKFPFNSYRKQSSVLVKENNIIRHYVIGAAEMVMQNCISVLTSTRKNNNNNNTSLESIIAPLIGDLRQQYEQKCQDFMNRGLRTLCLAVSERTVTNEYHLISSNTPPEDPLILIAIAGIEEPIRPEVTDAILSCKYAGVRSIMLTGDSMSTARNIAERCGMLPRDSPQWCAIDGPTLRTLSDTEVSRDIIPNLYILARATPLDKHRIVRLIKEDPNEVVAVTGDGTNDAPALKIADVGFAMNSGSDIAKRAADIVLLDDSFIGMVKATMWGRNVKGNIRKFLQFQLTVNITACVVAYIGALLNHHNMSPLKAVQLLWLNLIMDTLAALALATELPSPSLLDKKPERKNSSIITIIMVYNIASQCVFQLITQLLLLTNAHQFWDVPYFGDIHLTIVFNIFVLMQVFNFFNARVESAKTGLFENINNSKMMLYIVLIIFITQVLIIQFGGKFFSTVPLTVYQWLTCIFISMWSIPVGALTREYERRYISDMAHNGPIIVIVCRVRDVLCRAKHAVARLLRY